MKIAPSILSADFADLAHSIDQVANADMLHIDVMDGVFVPNITIGPAVVKALRCRTQLLFDVHLMIVHPELHIAAFADAGADIITVHAESTYHLHRAVQMIVSSGLRAGIAINPGTCASSVEGVIDLVDMILVMTVNPGFGGQAMISSTLHKVSRIRQMVEASGRRIDIQVDGGINDDTIVSAVQAGANVFVAGSHVFGAADPGAAVTGLRAAATAAATARPAK